MKAKGNSRTPPRLPPWLGSSGDALTIAVHAQPGAKREAIVGEHGDRLKIALTTPPVEGRANQALLKYLAKTLGLPRSAVSLVSGETSREKRVRIEGLSPDDLMARLGVGERASPA